MPLAALGLQRGDRVAILSENVANTEVGFRRGKAQADLCALNWRLTEEAGSLHSLDDTQGDAGLGAVPCGAERPFLNMAVTIIELGADYEKRLAAQPLTNPTSRRPEDGLVIIYTSGTAGLPKGA